MAIYLWVTVNPLCIFPGIEKLMQISLKT